MGLSAVVALLALLFAIITLSECQDWGPISHVTNFIVDRFFEFSDLISSFTNPLPQEPSVANLGGPWDFIVVGVGTAGSAIAARLSERTNWRILAIEAGQSESLISDIPLMASFVATSEYSWKMKAEPNKNYCQAMLDGRCNWLTGRAVGGTSVINFMVFSRGSSGDYDEWERMGNKGWSWKDVLPYFVKLEDTSTIPDIGRPGQVPRGEGGPLTIEIPKIPSELSKAFFQASFNYGLKYKDIAGHVQVGVAPVQGMTRRGARCSAAKAYLSPAKDRSNLFLAKGFRATKIHIDPNTKQTLGVEVLHPDGTVKSVIRASKEIVLSAGTVGSAHLLMLSGIGPAKDLQRYNIPVIADLPVGQFIQDHVSLSGLVFLVKPPYSLVEIELALNPQSFLNYLTRRTGPLSLPGGAEVLTFVRSPLAKNELPNEDHRKNDPDVEFVFGPGALTGDSSGSLSRLLGIDPKKYQKFIGPYYNKHAFSVVPVLMRPRSIGYLKLRSEDALTPPALHPNYYADERDLHLMVHAARMVVNISTSAPLKSFGSRLMPRPFPGCEKYWTNNIDPIYLPDSYWACAARQITTSLYHYVGSCRMGPNSDSRAVVTPDLRVRGVQGLRVADASIVPQIPASHTASVAMMIGERVSDFLKQTWS